MPKKSESVEECKRGAWAENWASALSGISKEDAEKDPALKKYREYLKEKACRTLLT